jgi:hypothetical protein
MAIRQDEFFNRIPVMVPLTAPLFGVFFLWEIQVGSGD